MNTETPDINNKISLSEYIGEYIWYNPILDEGHNACRAEYYKTNNGNILSFCSGMCKFKNGDECDCFHSKLERAYFIGVCDTHLYNRDSNCASFFKMNGKLLDDDAVDSKDDIDKVLSVGNNTNNNINIAPTTPNTFDATDIGTTTVEPLHGGKLPDRVKEFYGVDNQNINTMPDNTTNYNIVNVGDNSRSNSVDNNDNGSADNNLIPTLIPAKLFKTLANLSFSVLIPNTVGKLKDSKSVPELTTLFESFHAATINNLYNLYMSPDKYRYKIVIPDISITNSPDLCDDCDYGECSECYVMDDRDDDA